MFALPHIEKFMPVWVCSGLVLASVVAFGALLFVLAAASRQRETEDRKH